MCIKYLFNEKIISKGNASISEMKDILQKLYIMIIYVKLKIILYFKGLLLIFSKTMKLYLWLDT